MAVVFGPGLRGVRRKEINVMLENLLLKIPTTEERMSK